MEAVVAFRWDKGKRELKYPGRKGKTANEATDNGFVFL